MNEYCTHHECQCHAAADLAWMSARLGRNDLLFEAVEIHQRNKTVRCQRELSRGRSGHHGTGADAPLPERR